MRRRIAHIVLTMLVLLCACTADPVPTEQSTPAPTTNPMEAPTTEPPTAAPSEPTIALTNEERFQELLTQEYWYWRALSCTFSEPSEINAEFFFYNGLAIGERLNPSTFSEAERNLIDDRWGAEYGKGAWQNAQKMPTEKLESALSILNISLEDIQIPDDWIYYAEEDSYYAFHMDPFGVSSVSVSKVVSNGEGIAVYWSSSQPHTNTITGEIMREVQMVMVLKETADGRYYVVSNLPVET